MQSFGSLLRHWRSVRAKSQLALALDAEVSTRHLSFLETGRSQPSREMVLVLASALEVPLRERNELLVAAGFAPVYRESELGDETVAAAQRALDLILAHQEPFPAVVMNRRWDVVRVNAAAGRLFAMLLGEERAAAPANVLELVFDPSGLRPFIVNFEELAGALVERVRREAVGGVLDDATRARLARMRAEQPSRVCPVTPFVPVRFRAGELALDFFSTVTTLGTPQDITLQELRIECFFPADAATAARARALLG